MQAKQREADASVVAAAGEIQQLRDSITYYADQLVSAETGLAQVRDETDAEFAHLSEEVEKSRAYRERMVELENGVNMLGSVSQSPPLPSSALPTVEPSSHRIGLST